MCVFKERGRWARVDKEGKLGSHYAVTMFRKLTSKPPSLVG